jgi:hypothetical protein
MRWLQLYSLYLCINILNIHEVSGSAHDHLELRFHCLVRFCLAILRNTGGQPSETSDDHHPFAASRFHSIFTELEGCKIIILVLGVLIQ